MIGPPAGQRGECVVWTPASMSSQMEQAQAFQKMQVLAAQKNNLASQLQASLHRWNGRSSRSSVRICHAALGASACFRATSGVHRMQVANRTTRDLQERVEAQEGEQATVKAAVGAVMRVWDELNADIRLLSYRGLPQQACHDSPCALDGCTQCSLRPAPHRPASTRACAWRRSQTDAAPDGTGRAANRRTGRQATRARR